MVTSSPTSVQTPFRHSLPIQPVLSPVGIPLASTSMPTVKPSTRAIADATVNACWRAWRESTTNAPSSANQPCGVRVRWTPTGDTNWNPATSHSTARVSMASGIILRMGAMVSPWPFPTFDSVPCVIPAPESYRTVRASWMAIMSVVTVTGTPNRASTTRWALRTHDWKKPPLSMYPQYHPLRSEAASSLVSPSQSAAVVAAPRSRNPEFDSGWTCSCTFA